MTVTAQNFSYPSWLNRHEYPFKANFFKLAMGKMHYVDEGSGAPIVFLHGNPGWSFEYRKVIKELSKTHRCIAPDLIGFGLSDKPYDWNYLPKNHAANIEQFLEHLQLDGITLVVNDWGGPLGLSYAIRHPQKIKRLVILNTWMWPVSKDLYYRAFSGLMGGRLGRWLIREYNIFGKKVVKMAMGDKSKLTADIHLHYYAHLAHPQDRKGCYVFPKQIIASGEWLHHLWENKEQINSLPATFIWGMKDIAFREKELNYWLQHWHSKKTIKLQDVGHFPQEEMPDIIISELQTQ